MKMDEKRWFAFIRRHGLEGKNTIHPRLWKGLREAARELHMHKEIPILLRLQLGD